jgi:hypothetical protein
MHDHARRLVDDDQIGILVDDGQRNGFRPRVDRGDLGQGDAVLLTLGHPRLAVAGNAAGAADGALGDQARQTGPRQSSGLWHCQRKRLIKPVGRIGRDGDQKGRHGQR